jgi:hypothetical protein
MQNIGLILLVFAFVFAAIAAFAGPTVWPRAHFGWLAITFWIASELLGGLARVIH